MFEIWPLAVVHTVVAGAALLTGLLSLARSHEILLTSIPGMCYAYLCAMACLTGFGLPDQGFMHLHLIGVVTLALLGIAVIAHSTNLFGASWRRVEVIGYTTSFYLSLVSAISESFLQRPQHLPLFDTTDDPLLERILLMIVVLYAVTLALQLRELRLGEPEDVRADSLG
jgi:hypothetical protein